MQTFHNTIRITEDNGGNNMSQIYIKEIQGENKSQKKRGKRTE